jgi:hypothetical protein
MSKCVICGVEIASGNMCRHCEEEERIRWCREYEQITIGSPNENSLAAWYKRDKRGGI